MNRGDLERLSKDELIELENWRHFFGQRPAEIKWIPAGLC